MAEQIDWGRLARERAQPRSRPFAAYPWTVRVVLGSVSQKRKRNAAQGQ